MKVSGMDCWAVDELVLQLERKLFHENMAIDFTDVKFKELCTAVQLLCRHEIFADYCEIIL